MYIDELSLVDCRAIGTSHVSFVHPNSASAGAVEFPNLNVVVGINGGGKSSVLKAIALAIAVLRGTDIPDDIREWPRIGGSEDLEVRLLGSDGDGQQRWIESSVRVFRNPEGSAPLTSDGPDRPPSGVFAAYGADRLGRERDPEQDFAPRALERDSLLHGNAELVPIRGWFSDSLRQEEIAQILNAMLPPDIDFVPEGLGFTQRGVVVPERALSDGVQSFLAWICDLLFRMDSSESDRALADIEAIALVDEIDQRMHPAWQQSVISQLAAVLPRVQLICTIHSPLIPSGLRRENLLLAEPELELAGFGGTAVRRLSTEDVYGRTADQVLTSSYFDLMSTRSGRFREDLRVLALQAQGLRTGREAAVEFMMRLANPDRNQAEIGP